MNYHFVFTREYTCTNTVLVGSTEMLVYMRANAVSAGRTISLECHFRVRELPSLEMIMTVATVLLHVVGKAPSIHVLFVHVQCKAITAGRIGL